MRKKLVMTDQKEWWIYRGRNSLMPLPPPPPWRTFGEGVPDDLEVKSVPPMRPEEMARGDDFQVEEHEIASINAALLLRRPLFITGRPGSGKSTLAYAVARELQLGKVLYWPITSHVTLRDGLYSYDAIGRLQETTPGMQSASNLAEDIGRYLRLGPLGTALLPSKRPRVLLIDEIDKSDMDLPNDLLHVFEEGMFEIPELARLAGQKRHISVMQHGGISEEHRVLIDSGQIRCKEFPFIVLTSNEERAFPPAFLRRCLRLTIRPPDETKLAGIVKARFKEYDKHLPEHVEILISRFGRKGDRATDQLLNAIYLAHGRDIPDDLLEALWKPLTSEVSDQNEDI
jgi:MoxR-like ATPase